MASSGRAYVTNARPFDPLVTVSIGICTCKKDSEKSQEKSRKVEEESVSTIFNFPG
jgi:hypothetical protein